VHGVLRNLRSRKTVVTKGGRGLQPTRIVIDGVPFDEIAKEAKAWEADLIVIATHGYTGLKHVLLGSTTERVVRHAPCPVLVVR
jgi:nucleotide-binding universal stress UspA family protein